MTRVQAPVVHAAGAVLWRERDGQVEVAVTHRPRYDDWSMPKGKVDPGETIAETAVREIAEETGYRAVLGRLLPAAHYEVSTQDGGRAPKVVTYFTAEAVGGEFTSNDEVDELRWTTPAQARGLLSYSHDQTLLEAFLDQPVRARTVLLARHAKAGKRERWTGDDDLRPLTGNGREQAAALAGMLAAFDPKRLYTAPRVRCAQTLEPLSARLGLPMTEEWLLSEEGFWPDPEAGMRRFLAISEGEGTAVVSSQGGVIPEVITRVAELADPPSRKGSLWILTCTPPGESLKVRTADYWDDPLPPYPVG
ncbi:8-oxo-dGTP diphosphatase [Crossiella equi]|uniref:8-oxo-dGTP diphosphatase n=1 Tax=Crossiella equi TaxID=130796 RepID=A0ABS5AK66_9PSEU|nr:NUDIX hydrolase [Crossiella equi]MBP2476963.1 8-oxo-dGTP diphosphatase [Crossiella equi]